MENSDDEADCSLVPSEEATGYSSQNISKITIQKCQLIIDDPDDELLHTCSSDEKMKTGEVTLECP